MQEPHDLYEPAEWTPPGGIVSRYLKALRLAVMAACLVWVVWYFYTHRSSLQLFTSLSLPVIITLLTCAVIHLVLYSLQFYLVLRACAPQSLPFFVFFKTIILGRILSNIVPQGGNVYRAVYFKHKFGISYTHYLGGFFCFLWIDAAMNILLAAAVFGWCEPGFHVGTMSIWLILLAMGAGWCTPILFEALFRRYTFHEGWMFWIHCRVSKMLTVTIQSLSHVKMLGIVILANLVNFANTMLFFYLCVSGFGNEVTIPVLMVFFVLMKITSYLMITPGNFGLREIAYAFLGQQMGMDAGEAMVLSLIHRLAVLLMVVLLAVCLGGEDLLSGGRRLDEPDGGQS